MNKLKISIGICSSILGIALINNAQSVNVHADAINWNDNSIATSQVVNFVKSQKAVIKNDNLTQNDANLVKNVNKTSIKQVHVYSNNANVNYHTESKTLHVNWVDINGNMIKDSNGQNLSGYDLDLTKGSGQYQNLPAGYNLQYDNNYHVANNTKVLHEYKVLSQSARVNGVDSDVISWQNESHTSWQDNNNRRDDIAYRESKNDSGYDLGSPNYPAGGGEVVQDKNNDWKGNLHGLTQEEAHQYFDGKGYKSFEIPVPDNSDLNKQGLVRDLTVPDGYTFSDPNNNVYSIKNNQVNVKLIKPIAVHDDKLDRLTVSRTITLHFPNNRKPVSYSRIVNNKDQIVQTLNFTRSVVKDDLTNRVLSESAWQGDSKFPDVKLPLIPGFKLQIS